MTDVDVSLLVLTDGRAACLDDTLRSARAHLPWGAFARRVLVNDSPDPTFAGWLDERYGDDFEILPPEPVKRGFSGAIRAGWSEIGPGPGYVFHLEDDFRIQRHVPVDAMAALLEHRPDLVQVALLRQPWNDREKAAGGLIDADRADFLECRFDLEPDVRYYPTDRRIRYVEHGRFFTTNPSLYRRRLLEREWPTGAHSEGRFWLELLRDHPSTRSCFLGGASDDPRVWHIGDERVGSGY